MKTRQGFVSNSSSSSFVIIGKEPPSGYLSLSGEPFYVGKEGNLEFGWENTLYVDVYDRVNFAYIQAMSVENPDWLEMLERVITDHTGCSEVINTITVDSQEADEDNELRHGYIDHQSCATEGVNTEIFKSSLDLAFFLFSPESAIQGGNDNE